jgi:hypothetical protein
MYIYIGLRYTIPSPISYLISHVYVLPQLKWFERYLASYSPVFGLGTQAQFRYYRPLAL